MKHLTISLPLATLAKGLGFPDGIEIVAIREGDDDVAKLKIAVPDGVIPEASDDMAVVMDGVTERPACSFRLVPSKGGFRSD